ncbi:MAG: S8 family serine peptidase, partial [Bacteroidales bacterium]|nr:S8 family serine peptidase [Bacteroidales bacterium]
MKIDKFVIILVCWMMLIPPASSQSSPFQSGKLLIQLNQNHPIAHNPDNSNFLNLFQSEVSGFASIQKEFKINQVERSIKLENRENINLKNFYTLSFDTLANLDSIISRFRQLEMVETIDKIGFFQVDFTPNDSLYSQGLQWYLHRIEADSVWNFTLGNPHIKIAVVDDAILIRHKDLQSTISVNQAELNTIFSDSNSNGIIDVPDLLMHYNCFDISELWLTGLFDGLDNDGNGYIDDLFGWDFNLQTNDPNPSLFPYLENDHGTAVAGLISATTNNSLGIASLGSGCSILPLKVFGTYGPSSLHILEAMSYAYDQYADIINISMTGTSNSALDSLVVALYEDEVFLVASAGNSNSTLLGFPAANPLSIVVAALDSFDLKHPTSNYGTSIDLCAPGISMTTLAKSGDDLFAYRHDFGATSGAAPLVSGLLGLMKSFYPDFAYSALYSCLLSSTDSLTADSYFLQQQLGAGRINARKAMECLKNQALVADFYMADTTLCAGETIQLSDLSEGNIASWKWYSDNGATFDADTAQHPLITFHSLVDSIYTISLEISNINLLGPNYVSTLTKQVHVQPDLLNLGNDMVGLCSTVPYTLSISLPEVFSYFWSTGETTS